MLVVVVVVVVIDFIVVQELDHDDVVARSHCLSSAFELE
jgi:hypothetical protein